MKITTFNSFIATSKTDETISLFEELGFERHHKKEGIEIAERDDTVIRMKDPNGRPGSRRLYYLSKKINV